MTKAKTVKTRLLYAFAVPLLLMLALGVQSFFAIHSMHKSIESCTVIA
jgi:methyl-accepting chemotaxis protein